MLRGHSGIKACRKLRALFAEYEMHEAAEKCGYDALASAYMDDIRSLVTVVNEEEQTK